MKNVMHDIARKFTGRDSEACQKRRKKAALSILLSIAMVIGMLPVTSFEAQAKAEVFYRYPVYNTAETPSSGVKSWGIDKVQDSYYSVKSSDQTWQNNHWYVVDSTVDLSQGVTVNGNVSLVLLDGCTLTVTGANCKAGICVSGEGNSLTIYAGNTTQTITGTGTLAANGGVDGAGIGGNSGGSGSNITINGGTVTAVGGSSGAGIGGGQYGTGSNILINGGTVNAKGSGSGAGIGDGAPYPESHGSNIRLNGGNVTATSGGSDISGIGTTYMMSCYTNICAADSVIVKAGSAENPTEVIGHTSATDDISYKINQKQYVTAATGPAPSEKEVSTEKELKDAINNASSATTIKLTADIDLEATVNIASTVPAITLDLNGHVLNAGNISQPTSQGDKASVLYNEGTLTIIDSNPTATHEQTGLTDITGGVLTGGKGFKVDPSKVVGGAIYNVGTLAMSGGTIYGNSAGLFGGGVYSNGTFTMTGGTISGNKVTNEPSYGGGVFNQGTMIVGGTARIVDNTANGATSNLHENNAGGEISYITISTETPLASGASIGISFYSASFPYKCSTNGTADDVKYFFADAGTEYHVEYNNTGNYLEIVKVNTVEVKNETELTAAITNAQAGDVIKLGADIDLNATIDVETEPPFTLDLNGHVLNAGNITATTTQQALACVIYIGDSSGTLTIIDSDSNAAHTDWNGTHPTSEGNADLSGVKGGVLTGGKGRYYDGFKGGAINNIGKLTMDGGTIIGNKADLGAGVYNTTSSSSFTMTGGTITGNQSTADGGGVYNKSGTFTMTGGTITGNTAATNGGGVYNSKTFTMTGGEITDNTGHGVYNASAKLTIGGTAKISGNTKEGTAFDLHLLDGKTFSISSTSPLTTGASVGVTMEDPTDAMTDATATSDDAQYFHSNDSQYSVVFDSESNTLKLKATSSVIEVATEDALKNAISQASAATTIKLTADINLAATVNIASGKDITLDLSGHKLDGKQKGSVITNAGTLTVKDSSDPSTGKITGGKADKGGGVYNSGTFNLAGGTISNNTVTKNGGGVFNNENASFTMTGGAISDNQAHYGAGVHNMSNGTFIMTDGTISNNTADQQGGGVNNCGTFSLTGGTISGNKAIYGGGVRNDKEGDKASFIVTGGNVTGNTGGGVKHQGKSLTIGGTAKISGNTKEGTAYDLLLLDGKTFSISSTSPLTTGASVGVTMDDPTDAMTDATAKATDAQYFSSNDSQYSVEFDSESNTLKLKAASSVIEVATEDALKNAISQASAATTIKLTADINLAATVNIASGKDITLDLNGNTLNGAGITDKTKASVITNAGTLTIKDGSASSDGKITGGTGTGDGTDKCGGGIYNASTGTLTITGGTITGNTADTNGGGVYHSGVSLTIGGTAKISGNTKDGTANDLYLPDGKTFSISTNLTTGASVGVTMEDPTDAMTDATAKAADAQYFHSNDSQYTVAFDSANNTLKLAAASTVEVATEAELISAISQADEATTIKLTADISLTAALDVENGKEITLDLNGKTLNGDITNSGRLTIKEPASGSTNTINGSITNDGRITIAGPTDIAGFTNKKYGTATLGEVTVSGDCTLEAVSETRISAADTLTVAGCLTNAGQIVVDMTGATDASVKLIDAGENSDYGISGTNYKFASAKGFGYTLAVNGTDLYAEKEATCYNVYFNMGGHGDQVATQSVAEKKRVDRPDDPEEDGYRFVNWYKTGAFETVWNFLADKVEETTTLYAKWMKGDHIVTVRDESSKDYYVEDGEDFRLPKNEKTNFLFWQDSSTGTTYDSEETITVNRDVTIEAIYGTRKEISGKERYIISAPDIILSCDPAGDYERLLLEDIGKTYEVLVNKPDLSSHVRSSALKNYLVDDEGESLWFYMIIDLESIENTEDGTARNLKLTYRLTPWCQTVDNGCTLDLKQVENKDLSGNIVLKLAVPNNVTQKYGKVEHMNEDGSVKDTQYKAVQTGKNNGVTYKYVEVTARSFSDFVISFADEKPEDPTSDDGNSASSAKPVKTGTWNDPVTNGTWAKGTDGRWTYTTNAVFRSTWGYILNPYAQTEADKYAWFWFDANGKMVTGWQKIGGAWYYFNETSDGTLGAMKQGWITWKGNQYYLTETRDGNGGKMLTGFQTIGGKTYFFREKADGAEGAMATGLKEINESTYYFDERQGANYGVMYVNQKTPDGRRAGSDGVIR